MQISNGKRLQGITEAGERETIKRGR